MYMEVQVPQETGEGETAQRSSDWPGSCRERTDRMSVSNGLMRDYQIGSSDEFPLCRNLTLARKLSDDREYLMTDSGREST